MVLNAIIVLILSVPALVEIQKEEDGDVHPNNDWIVRGFLCIIAAIVCSIVSPKWGYWIDLLAYTTASILIFVAIFDYSINFVHLKKGITTAKIRNGLRMGYAYLSTQEVIMHVLTYLNDSAWPDKTWWWKKIGWQGRLVVRLICFTISSGLVRAQGSYFGGL